VTKVAFFRRSSDDGLAGNQSEVRREETEVRGGGPPLVRALFTLVGVAAAGLLIWLAQTFDLTETNGFWAGMALIAAAGLALGLSQLIGGWTKWGLPIMSPGVFLLAFIPTGIAVGWILLATQPEGGWQQARLAVWSDDIGISGFVNDLGTVPAALAMGLGIVFAFTFDTTGPRTRIVTEEHDVVPDEDVHDYDSRAGVTAPVRTTTNEDDRTLVTADSRPAEVETSDPERRDTP
jgi:hypothetical protein